MRPSGSDSYYWGCLFNVWLGCLATIFEQAEGSDTSVRSRCLPDQIRTLRLDFSSGRAPGNLIDTRAFTACESKTLQHTNERSG